MTLYIKKSQFRPMIIGNWLSCQIDEDPSVLRRRLSPGLLLTKMNVLENRISSCITQNYK
jgi:hypothetical protein